MNEIISAVLVVGGTGLIFGCLLAFASMVFHVKQDDRIDKISEILPGANCGACGYAGCNAYASAVVNDGAPVNACSVGKVAVSRAMASIMGVEAGSEAVSLVAHVMCSGDCNVAPRKFNYMGIPDCTSLVTVAGGDKECPNGCLGLGSCVSVCPFGAIAIKDGLAVVDSSKCTGCGKCVRKCPKQVITLVPANSKVFVNCSNTEKGGVAAKHCKASCIGCKICEKACIHDAIHINNNLATVDYNKCVSCGECAEKCPKHAIGIIK